MFRVSKTIQEQNYITCTTIPRTSRICWEHSNLNVQSREIQFGLYYSILDWNHPSQNISTINGTTYSTMTSMTARTNYITDMKAHLQELITKYDPAILWFDGDWCGNPASPTLTDWWIESDGLNLYNYLLGLKPSLIVNERVKRGFGLGDWDCPEQTVPAAPLSRPWETCETMNGAWGYNEVLSPRINHRHP